MRVEHLAEGVTLYNADCREVLPTFGKVDAVVTDYLRYSIAHGNHWSIWTFKRPFGWCGRRTLGLCRPSFARLSSISCGPKLFVRCGCRIERTIDPRSGEGHASAEGAAAACRAFSRLSLARSARWQRAAACLSGRGLRCSCLRGARLSPHCVFAPLQSSADGSYSYARRPKSSCAWRQAGKNL